MPPRPSGSGEAGEREPTDEAIEFVARRLLARYGVVFRRVLARERIPVAWWRVARFLRLLELRGEVRGGRFVGGFSGEQFALPGAVRLLRRTAREGSPPEVRVSAADPLNLRGILTPEERIPASARDAVSVGAAAAVT